MNGFFRFSGPSSAGYRSRSRVHGRESYRSPDCCAISRWSSNVCQMHLHRCIFETHPLSKYDSIDLLWCSFLKCPVTYLGTYLGPSTPENQNIDTMLVEYLSSWFRALLCPNILLLILVKTSRLSEWPPIFCIQSVAWHFEFSVSCLVNPDPTVGPASSFFM
jgi:hypothetical protein